MEKKEVLLIKLGGSVITDKSKPYTANIPIIRDLARQLLHVRVPYILAHGSGSFGHTSAKQYGGVHGYTSPLGVAKVALDAMAINAIVMNILLEEGIPAVSFRPMAMVVASGGNVSDYFFSSIGEALTQQLIPVVYGDIIWDTKWKSTIFSGEKTLNYLAEFLQRKGYIAKKIIEIGNTDGVYDAHSQTIPLITKNIWQDVKQHVLAVEHDVTGGMLHKVESALEIADKGIETAIISGYRKNSLQQALKGKFPFATYIR